MTGKLISQLYSKALAQPMRGMYSKEKKGGDTEEGKKEEEEDRGAMEN